MPQPGYFYILTNAHHTALYCGATDNIYRRMQEHKSGVYKNSFTSRYNINILVYLETFTLIGDAFAREKQVKAGSRMKKIELIETANPEWTDLFEQLHYNLADELA